MPENIDILEDTIYNLSPTLLLALLRDCTTSTAEIQRNIFWATSDYEHIGKGYEYLSPIMPNLIIGDYGNIIMPRVLKSKTAQSARSKDMAEVFTPSWICNAQNNLIDNAWFGYEGAFNHENDDHTWSTNYNKINFPEGKTWRDYVRDTRLEITCGEAPYIVSRYDTTTGVPIPLVDRIGLLDRKLRVVSENTETSEKWLDWAQVAYKSIYAYEWQGDNLLLARESMLISFIEYYKSKFNKKPRIKSLNCIADIIAWNVWQMDGLKCVIPNSCHDNIQQQQTLFDGLQTIVSPCEGCRSDNIRLHNGTYCLIKDWKAKPSPKKIRFIDLLK